MLKMFCKYNSEIDCYLAIWLISTINYSVIFIFHSVFLLQNMILAFWPKQIFSMTSVYLVRSPGQVEWFYQ